MKAILIAEKQSLMREIQSVYNKHKTEIGIEIDFLAQAGHLVGLKLPKEVNAEKYGKWDLKFLPEVYPYEYHILHGKTDLVNKIKTAVKSGGYDYVIHAGDPDGEGELLVRLVLSYVGNKLPVKRFWSNDLTENAILGALKNLRDDSELDTVYEAALVRQHADYQFGMNVTSAVTLKMGDLCKLGRVKAPIIAMIVEREKAIRDFVEKITYKPAFDYSGCEFVSDKVFDEEKDALAFNPIADNATVSEAKTKRNSKKAPKLFKLSTLQTEAHKSLKMNGAETLETLQLLYEKKATSYPRTDCEYISSAVDIGGIAKNVLREVSIDTKLLVRDPKDVLADKTYANDKAIATEGHTAVIPTGNGLPASASKKEKDLYELICRRFLAMFAGEKVTESIKVSAVPAGSDKVYVYSESIDIDPGFEYVLNPEYKMKTGKGVSFANGMKLSPIKFYAKEVVSKPPARYNEGSLIEALDKPEAFEGEDGKVKFKIGTPATRANIIQECQENGYFTVKSGAYYATSKAESVVDTFTGIALFNPVESGRWEDIFNHIKTGAIPADEAENELIGAMKDTVEKMKAVNAQKIAPAGAESIGKCPKCGSAISKGKFGPYCTGKCGMSIGKYMGKTLTDTQIKNLLDGKKVLVKGLTSKKTGKTYDVFIKANGVESFSYTKADGNTTSGYQWTFETEFPKK